MDFIFDSIGDKIVDDLDLKEVYVTIMLTMSMTGILYYVCK